MKYYVRTLAGPLLILTVITGAFWLLHHELREYQLDDFLDSLHNIPPSARWVAVGLTCLNYLILLGYDLLGVTYLGQKINFAKVAFGSFLGCAVGNNLGTLLGGSTVRYRLYSAWGLTAVDIVRLVLILTVTFWIGLFAVAGVMFIWWPVAIPGELHLPLRTTFPLGVLLLLLAAAYLVVCAVRPKGLKLGSWEFSPPPVGLSLMQYLVATLDLAVAAGVLYVLLPNSVEVGYFAFLTIYLLGLIATLITQVPGGIGLLELLIVVLLNPTNRTDVMGALLAFRVIYFLFPLAIGLFMLGLHEIAVHQDRAREAFSVLGKWAPTVAPRLLTSFVFFSGIVLLFAGATPSKAARLQQLQLFLPLAVVELSHVFGSIVGVLLLALTRGLQRRTERAYIYACGLLAAGAVSLVLQGAHYGLAVVLAVVLVVLLPARQYFFRRDVRLGEYLSFSWLAAFVGAVGCAVWLFFFAFKYVTYQHELWWQFALDQTAARSLRATFAAVTISLTLLAARLLRVREPMPGLPTPQQLRDALRIARASRRADSHLAAVGDKRLLFNRQRDGLVMFDVWKSSCIAMGDPVGPETSIRELAWEFWEVCDASGRRTVFYQVAEENLPLYVELGLAIIKIGEEARVFLPNFDLDGPDREHLRRVRRTTTEADGRCQIIQASAVAPLLPELRQISAAWLAEKQMRERRFSVGFFQEDYLRQNPLAIVRVGPRMVAFANLWVGSQQEELSVDLIRFLPDAPREIINFLLTELMLWGRQQGFRWFNLGMAPLDETEAQPHAPVWNELADVIFRHGEHSPHFQGLREYQLTFRPQWRSKYLACPAGLALPVVLADVSSLISGAALRSRRK